MKRPCAPMLAIAVWAAMWGAQPAAAQDDADAQVAEILEGFLGEQRRVLTCSSLDALNHASLLGMWDLFVEDVLSLMKQGGVSILRQAAFAAAARPEALVMPGDAPFSAVREFCDADPEWSTRVMRFGSFPRYSELRMLLESR